eukprot:8694-Pelagococcus_subviridis.AAC.3
MYDVTNDSIGFLKYVVSYADDARSQVFPNVCTRLVSSPLVSNAPPACVHARMLPRKLYASYPSFRSFSTYCALRYPIVQYAMTLTSSRESNALWFASNLLFVTAPAIIDTARSCSVRTSTMTNGLRFPFPPRRMNGSSLLSCATEMSGASNFPSNASHRRYISASFLASSAAVSADLVVVSVVVSAAAAASVSSFPHRRNTGTSALPTISCIG